MRTLAFDLSTRRGSIAVSEDGELFAATQWQNDRRTSAPFFCALGQAIGEQRFLDRIVVGLGPGSYTGTRIAIAAALGLQITTRAQLTGLASIAAVSSERRFAVIGDAKRQSFFFAIVADGRMCRPPELLSQSAVVQQISELDCNVYTSDHLPQFTAASIKFPSAELLCCLADRGVGLMEPPLSPLYLREPHITVPAKATRI